MYCRPEPGNSNKTDGMNDVIIKSFVTGALAAAFTILASQAMAAGNPAKGKKVFNKCRACHTVKAGKHRTGPSLHKVVGRKAGTAQGFKKYRGLKDAGWTWTEAELDAYLTDPKKYLRAKNRKRGTMVLKLKKASDRENVIAYIKSIE